MTLTIAVHSYRGGTGKSTTTSNTAVLLAAMGHTVVTIDLDLTSPGLHVIYGVAQKNLPYTLNDFLFNQCTLKDIVVDVTQHLGIPRGKLYFIGASMKPEEIAKLMQKGYNETVFRQTAHALGKEFGADVVIFDTHPGLTEDTLMSVLSSDVSLVIMRLDRQDISGTYLLLQILRKFKKVSYVLLNMVPPNLASNPSLPEELAQTLGAPILGVIPFYDEVLAHRSKGVFSLHHPSHPYTVQVLNVAKTIASWIQ